MAEVTTQDKIPSYQEKKFIELSDPGLFNYFESQVPDNRRGLTVEEIAKNPAIRLSGIGGDAVNIAKSLNERGLGSLQIGDIIAGKNNASFVERYGLGKAFSYQDLATEALSADPNFDPADEGTISAFAQDLEKRGLKNTDREKIYTLATSQGVKSQIDKALNPGKYQSEAQKAETTGTAQRLLQQYGFGEDQDLQDFVAERLAGGESAFELGQFLQTTPQFQERRNAQENERVKAESAAARESLNQELLKSQQEVFQRAQPSIIASYMRAGRLNSSGLNSALAQAQAELEKERQGFVANAGYNDAIRAQGYGRENFVNTQANAFNQYLRQNEPAYQQRFAVNQASNFANYQQPYNQLNRQYGLIDEARQRQYQLEDYTRQQSDYMRYLNSQGGSGASGALRGALSGAGAGASFGPWGALIGAGLGAAGGYAAYK